MKKVIVASALFALVAADCSGGKECDSADTDGCETGLDDTASADDTAVEACADCVADIENVNWDYDEVDWFGDVYANGWTGTVDMYIYQTGSNAPWFEYGHPFPPTSPWSTATQEEIDADDTRGYYDDAGYWDNAYMVLNIVTATGDVELGSTTLFQGNADRASTLTWAVVTHDTSETQVDCFAWGGDTSFSGEGFDFGACRS